ncbi:MAG TPA: trehalase family glycosidase [Candidatus Paceibacterota bacterium]|nr:trehalase family glycosidase [Candidatus Paceibacterota bacterium]
MTTAALRERVDGLMRKNRRVAGEHMYTVPSPEHYPFQWLWDSCFHAIILSHLDPALARAELRSVLAKPLASGLIPHMIYWEDSYEGVKWGREKQGDLLSAAWGVHGVSSITQPPVIATAVWQLHVREPDAAFIREIYPMLRAHYLALLSERSFGPSGLLGIINPDESGEDNSPRFDSLQGLPPRHDPVENFSKRIERVREHVACNFDVQNCMVHRFWVEDVSFNAISIRGLEALSRIAREIGDVNDAVLFSLSAQQLRTSMQLHMKRGTRYYSLQGESEEEVIVDTWTLFMPLFAELLHPEEAKELIETALLDKRSFFTKYPVPSVSRREPSYTDDDLWRGPTWAAANWFIYKGLLNYGYDDVASTIRERTIELLDRSGFREFYNAETGEGYGAHEFTWGGLVLDMDGEKLGVPTSPRAS